MADFEQTLNVASGKNSFTTLIISDPTNSIIKTSADSDWITVENPQWTGSTASSVFTITENTGTTVRTGRVYISATTIEDSEYEGTVTKALEGTIVQKEGLSYYVKSSISSSSVVSAATSVTITISANTSWTISSDSSWATLYKTSGSGNASIKVTITKNSGGKRTAVFTIKSTTCTPDPSLIYMTQDYSITKLEITAFKYGDSWVSPGGGTDKVVSLNVIEYYPDGTTGTSTGYVKTFSLYYYEPDVRKDEVWVESSSGTVTWKPVSTTQDSFASIKLICTKKGITSDGKNATSRQKGDHI